METLAIDIETYSDIDLGSCGVYKYVDSAEFKILLFAYAFGDEEVQIIDLEHGERLPTRVVNALANKEVIKTAFNAQFERVCINKHFGIKTENWDCTMVKALSLGLPASLEKVGQVLGLEEQKLADGKRLINKFSKPSKKAEITSMSLFDTEDPDWELFKKYCIRDVEVEREVRQKLSRFELLEVEKKLYALDQVINDRGVLLDVELIKNAIAIDTEQNAILTKTFQEGTGLANPRSLTDIKNLIRYRTGKHVPSITKSNIKKLQDKFKEYEDISIALEVREQLSRTSIAKYQKMLDVACSDNRARGLMFFYGARTGRWAGRLLQPQNLPGGGIKDLDTALECVRYGDLELLEMLYDSPADVLSNCLRPAIIPARGKKFIIVDFSAIEARVLAWLAGEEWRIEVFKTHGKIYEASASAMFNVPIEQIDKGSPLRQKGKIAELALGYQGSVGALKQMGALEMGLTEEELPELVAQWRQSNRQIVRFWYDTDRAAKKAIRERTTVNIRSNLKAIYQSGFLFIELPSGRRLAYPKPRLRPHHNWEGEKITFEGENSTTRRWEEIDTYGGKLVENIVQATARDCLAYSMLALEEAGYKIVMHVHDEVVIEIDKDRDALEEVAEIMGRELPWAKGLPLRGDGFESMYYLKD